MISGLHAAFLKFHNADDLTGRSRAPRRFIVPSGHDIARSMDDFAMSDMLTIAGVDPDSRHQ